mmetsp:Transcript_49108/g.141187  ORF Transcript_49108/g.141187 Transcript_49108/m.141187 type:complete len:277 (+) Transcript_49108:239-1069(+)|eukprot:CAMPEP_0176010210 /NCGR_PEP_ID=MMETSP0120_2-20121206/4649_1 /TAXON_ID=160619 /ORGANISM="Kryptoperidinium foliaceum, Strain CCMP 1326" /LENGTH=276 /DNA_ID=CAMNT_0017343031 /DNA_START=154 /DNA_END=984 /DNA_ORIENTATION=-
MTQIAEMKHVQDRMSLPAEVPELRFTLKKRPTQKTNDVVNLSSYNSAFLTGLFADVAKVSDVPSTSKPKRSASSISVEEDAAPEKDSTPCKKSRISLSKCFSRCRTSAMNLPNLGAASPKGINELFRSSEDSRANTCLESPRHEDSLHFQLNCVSDTDSCRRSSQKRKSSTESAAKIAFPNLPATVSDSSCQAGLTRVNLVRQASSPENSTNESFGWFVDLDDNHAPETNASLPYTVSSDSLAFQAPTAPKASNDVAELEWAQAADTIDDVLGDFF